MEASGGGGAFLMSEVPLYKRVYFGAETSLVRNLFVPEGFGRRRTGYGRGGDRSGGGGGSLSLSLPPSPSLSLAALESDHSAFDELFSR